MIRLMGWTLMLGSFLFIFDPWVFCIIFCFGVFLAVGSSIWRRLNPPGPRDPTFKRTPCPPGQHRDPVMIYQYIGFSTWGCYSCRDSWIVVDD